MGESNNDEERRLRIQRTLQRLIKATAELEELGQAKGSSELSPFAPRDPRTPVREWEHV